MLTITQRADGSGGWQDGNGLGIELPTYVETVSSTATTLTRFGLTLLSSTGAKTFVLGAPTLGCYKELVKTANSTAITTVSCGSGITIGGSTKVVTKILMNGQNDAAVLRGISATKWYLTGNNSVTLST